MRQIYNSTATPHPILKTYSKSNFNAIKQARLISPLAGHKSNRWFNALAAAVVVVGIIYAAYHLADELSVVRDTRAYPFTLLGIALAGALH